jgi:hypothetical protein
MGAWSILQSFVIFYGHLVKFIVIWYIYSCCGILYQEKSGNPDTLTHFTDQKISGLLSGPAPMSKATYTTYSYLHMYCMYWVNDMGKYCEQKKMLQQILG